MITNIFAAIYMVLSFQKTPLFDIIGQHIWAAFILVYVLSFIWSLIGIFISVGIWHLFFLIVKAKGNFKDTFNAWIYSSVPGYLFTPAFYILGMAILVATMKNSFISILSLVLVYLLLIIGFIVWLVMVQLKAFSILHKISKLRAATALYFIPIGIAIVVVVILMVFFASLFMSLMAASTI